MGSDVKESALFKAKTQGRGHSVPGGAKGRKSLPVAMDLEAWQEATARSMQLGGTLISRPRSTGKAKTPEELEAITQTRARVCLHARMADLVVVKGTNGGVTWADVGDELSPTFSGSYLAQAVRGARPASKKLLVALGLVRVKKDSRRRLRMKQGELEDLANGRVPLSVRARARALVEGTFHGVLRRWRLGALEDDGEGRNRVHVFVGGAVRMCELLAPIDVDLVDVPTQSPDGAEHWLDEYAACRMGGDVLAMIYTGSTRVDPQGEA